MATLCTLTGVLRDRQNTVLANTQISFAFRNGVVGSGDVYSPVVETTTTDGSGNISIQLTNGSYTGTLISNGRVETFTLNVPAQASADIADYIDQDADMTPALVQQVLDAAAQAAQYDGPRFESLDAFEADTALTFTTGQAGTVAQGDEIRIGPNHYEVTANGAGDGHYSTTGSGGNVVEIYEAGPSFSTRARLVAAHDRNVAASQTIPGGTVWTAGGVAYERDSTSTDISDLTGWTWFGQQEPEHLGNSGAFYPPEQRKARGLRTTIDAVEPLNRIRNEVVIEKRRTDFIEFAVYSALDADGIDFARFYNSTRFLPGNFGALDWGIATLAKLYASTAAVVIGENRTTGITASTATNTYATADATSRAASFTAAGTVGGMTDISYTTTTGDSVVYDVVVPAGGRIYMRAYANSANGGIAAVTIEDSGSAEIAAAEYLAENNGTDYIADTAQAMTGSGLTMIPLAECVDADTYTVTLTLDASSQSGGRLYDGGIHVHNAVAYNEAGIHGTAVASTSGGSTSDYAGHPGTVLVYQITNATRGAFEYFSTSVAGQADFTVYDNTGTEISSYENSSVDMYDGSSGDKSVLIFEGQTKGTFYVHVRLSSTKNAASTDIRMYAIGVTAFDQETRGVVGTDAFDPLTFPEAPSSLTTGTHHIGGPGNFLYATEWRSPNSNDGDEDFVGGVHQFETSLGNADITVKVDGATVAWSGAAVGDTFSGSLVQIDWSTKLYFPVAVSGDSHTFTITNITQASNGVVTAAAHGRTTGDEVLISGVAGMTEINKRTSIVTVIDANSFSLDDIDTSAYTAYSAGGAVQTPFATLSRSIKVRRGALVTAETNLTLIADAVQHIAYPLMLQQPNGGDTRADSVGGGFETVCAERSSNYDLSTSAGVTIDGDEWNEGYAFYNREFAVYGFILNSDELLGQYSEHLVGYRNMTLRDNTSHQGKAYTFITGKGRDAGGISLSSGFTERVVKAYRIVPTADAGLLLAS